MPSLTKWKPSEALESFFDDSLRMAPFFFHQFGSDLAVDIFDDEKNVVAEMAVPGVDPSKIDISVEGWMLTLSGSREEKSEKKSKYYYKKEIRSGHFERKLSLPAEVDPAKSTADCKDGVLRVVMPKKAGKEGSKRKIKIKSDKAK